MQTIALQGITWDHSRGFDPLIACSEHYFADTGIEIQWQKRTLKDFGDQSLQDLTRQYDLMIVDHPHSGVCANTNCVIPFDEYVPRDQLDILASQTAGPSFRSYFYAGHQWALPIDAAMQCAAYRPDQLTSPPPKTWKQVLNVDGLGMALCPTDSLCSFLSLSAQMGAPICAKNAYLVPEDTGIDVLTLMQKLHLASHPESIHLNPIQLFDLMAESDEITYTPMVFCYSNYARTDYRTNLLAFTDAPLWHTDHTQSDAAKKFSTVLGGAGIAISNNCQNKQQACDFSLWICSKEIQSSTYTQTAGQPSNIFAWENEENNKLTNNFFKNTQHTLELAYVRPRFAQWPTFQEHLGDVVHDFLVKGKNATKVIRYLNQKYSQLSTS